MKNMTNTALTGVLAFAAISSGTFFFSDRATAAEQGYPEQIVGIEVRRQGHDCNNPRNAKRDTKKSTPDQTVWELTCDEATYRVTLMPNLGTAKVVVLEDSKGKKGKMSEEGGKGQ